MVSSELGFRNGRVFFFVGVIALKRVSSDPPSDPTGCNLLTREVPSHFSMCYAWAAGVALGARVITAILVLVLGQQGVVSLDHSTYSCIHPLSRSFALISRAQLRRDGSPALLRLPQCAR